MLFDHRIEAFTLGYRPNRLRLHGHGLPVWGLAVLLLAVCLCFRPSLAADADASADVRQVWKVLDYLAVDYAGAVANGAVSSESEYGEMKEFAETAVTRLTALPPRDGQPALVKQAEELRAAIGALASPADVLAGAALVGQVVLYFWPSDGWVRGTVARRSRAAGFSHVVRYARTSALGSTETPSLLDAASHRPTGRWMLLRRCPR